MAYWICKNSITKIYAVQEVWICQSRNSVRRFYNSLIDFTTDCIRLHFVLVHYTCTMFINSSFSKALSSHFQWTDLQYLSWKLRHLRQQPYVLVLEVALTDSVAATCCWRLSNSFCKLFLSISKLFFVSILRNIECWAYSLYFWMSFVAASLMRFLPLRGLWA